MNGTFIFFILGVLVEEGSWEIPL